uniref:G_PROTEIN_RECEP_F1_2 domain-containing protein n=2 Tax=Caenorhabditis tropicalis TaxID=1561998 RepID=A0A1I7SZE3_9PELO
MSCTYRNSIFETDDFYLTSLHCISVIQVPLHVLGTYIIITKTPKKMEKVKYSMLFLHLWGAWMDLFVSILSVPVFFFPILSGYALGIMYYILPTWIICYIGFASIGVLGSAIVMFFENRYNYLVRTDSETFSRKIKRFIHHVFNFSFSLLVLTPPFFHPQEMPGFRETAQHNASCLPATVIYNPRLYTLNTTSTLIVTVLSIYLVVIFSQCIPFFVLTSRFVLKIRTVSNRTAHLQKQFFKALCIQISVPFLIVTIPTGYVFYVFYTGNLDVLLINGSAAWISTHGLFSTIVMLRVHKPYRYALLEMIPCKKSAAKRFRLATVSV